MYVLKRAEVIAIKQKCLKFAHDLRHVLKVS